MEMIHAVESKPGVIQQVNECKRLFSPTMPSSPSRSENKLACMTRTELGLIAIVVILALSCCRPRPRDKSFTDEQQPTTEAGHRDESPHTVHFVTGDGNVKLEVLDLGGSGRALVLLAGLGDTGHVFYDFAPPLANTYHVYGITRRGFGASSVPDSGYSADRLGDDVLAVIDSLGLTRPILVGHSIAGQEMSSIASRHPEKVAGLVYLEAAYFYAYYDPSRGNLTLDALDVQRKLDQLQVGKGPADQRPLIRELLNNDLPQLEKRADRSHRSPGDLVAIFRNAHRGMVQHRTRNPVLGLLWRFGVWDILITIFSVAVNC